MTRRRGGFAAASKKLPRCGVPIRLSILIFRVEFLRKIRLSERCRRGGFIPIKSKSSLLRIKVNIIS